MNIVWKPNPLETVVTLDPHETQLLRLRLEIEDLSERVLSAHVALDPEYRKERSLEESVVLALRRLDLGEDGKRASRLDKLLKDYAEALTGAHNGDCTCVPCGCIKCHAESLIGVDTIQGLGKHSACHVAGAFTPKAGEPTPGLDEVIERLKNYRPTKGAAWSKYTDEAFQQHFPRWISEAKQAHDWLVAYRQAHFSG